VLHYFPEAGKRSTLKRSPSTAEAMVYWRLKEQLERKGWTRFRLVRESGLPPTTVYRLARPNLTVARVDGRTLDILCNTLGCDPGDLLEHKRGRR
jgi:DNA-binding Xre family transcriptional regulator